jgi:uridine kinase
VPLIRLLTLERLNDDLRRLIAGQSVEIPRYDFITGTRQWHEQPLQLTERSVLIMEGIHGLNPNLTPAIDDDIKFKIYLSCLTSVALDNTIRIHTTDNRLLRRLVRDYRTRGNSGYDTIARWQSVRRGEEKHIFPYQENADVMINTSLFYEIGVLRSIAEPILREINDTVPEYGEAFRLLKFLENFVPVPMDEIPLDSVLREFVGGSTFKY